MKNWSGYIQWNPKQTFYPKSEEEISDIVKTAIQQNCKVRIIGSGHSFTPLCKTDDFLISLDEYQGVCSIDKTTKQATVKAGTKLNKLNKLLAKEGLALENLGDIDVQSIAGAISTGTHGTGTAFGNISTQIRKIRFVNGLGEVVICSPDDKPEVFKAAQISLGALGIITEITLQCVPAYNLELKIAKNTLDEILEKYPTINKENRHFEFYWFPNTKYVMTKELNVTQETPSKSSFSNYLQEEVLENYAFQLICEMSYLVPSWTKSISNFAAKTISSHRKVQQSHNVFSTSRIVRFNEIEYNIPIEAYTEVKKELVNWIDKNNKDVMFPIENRFVKGDEIYLSPAYKRDSAYIAVHVYHKKDFKKYFDALEAIFRAHSGRPHWGKMHQLTTDDIYKLYPEFETFKTVRLEQDPNGVFLSPYISKLLLNK